VVLGDIEPAGLDKTAASITAAGGAAWPSPATSARTWLALPPTTFCWMRGG